MTACLAAAIAVTGSALGQMGTVGALGGAVGLALLALRRKWAAAVLLTIAFAAGFFAAARMSFTLPAAATGPVLVVGEVASDPAPVPSGWAFVVRPDPAASRPEEAAGGRLAVILRSRPDASVGSIVVVEGTVVARPGRLHRTTVVGWLTARSVETISGPDGTMAVANWIRDRVLDQFPESGPGGALMRGFLIGDTSAMRPTALEDMRRAGLLHFVAVSGGNVAIFLGGVWLLIGLIPLGPRLRAAVGLAAVFLFVLITRWEPSVVRAGLMMSLLLAGRIGGIPIDGWTALGGAATILALGAPQLMFDVGFQLSALATAGLLLGANAWSDRRPPPLWQAFGATLAAQLAVTPLLLIQFGSVPAFSAVANVAAAPLVSIATALGWARVFTGIPVVDTIAEVAASWVISLAEWAAELPQVGLGGVAATVGIVAVARRKAAVGIALVVGLLALALLPAPPVRQPTAVFLDIGQGDAVLLQSPGGAVVAVDTGPDPVVYRAALRRHGVDQIDLLVLTHTDGDHVGGLEALVDRVPVGKVWVPRFTPRNDWNSLLSGIAAPLETVGRGATAVIGSVRLSVISPSRRFATDNDGSIVLWVEAGGLTLLLPGDIESVGQAELPEVHPDILLVPHHGSRTTDLDWLERTIGQTAVLSYGENSYGHPAAETVEVLVRTSAKVLRTETGDVTIRLDAG